MKRPVSLVVRAADGRAALEALLPVLVEELARRAAGDELVLLDEGPESGLAAWAAARFPPPATFERASWELNTLRQARRAAFPSVAHELVFLCSASARPEPGFLEPLVAALDGQETAGACPGEGEAGPFPRDERGLLLRRAELPALAPDALFASDGWQLGDLAWRLRREGKRVVHVPASRVEAGAPEPARALAEARDRWLFTWKHLDEEALWREHLSFLLAEIVRAAGDDRREALAALVLAFEDLQALARSRPAAAARVRWSELVGEPAVSGARVEALERQA